MSLTNSTSKTCTITTTDQAVDKTLNIHVVATDSVSTDSAERTTTYVQKHTDTNVAPVFDGPEVNNVLFPINIPVSGFFFAPLFTGTNLVYDTVGTWPANLSVDPATSELTGTPVSLNIGVMLSVTATNSKGVAQTNTFEVVIDNASETVQISGTTPISCVYVPPDTTCVVSSDYLATPSNFIEPVTSWVWSVSSGVATITAGQGMDTVTVAFPPLYRVR